MTFTVGGVDVTAVHVGATAADAVYLGAVKVWPTAPPHPWTYQGESRFDAVALKNGDFYPRAYLEGSAAKAHLYVAKQDASGYVWALNEMPVTGQTLTVTGSISGAVVDWHVRANTEEYAFSPNAWLVPVIRSDFAALTVGETVDLQWS